MVRFSRYTVSMLAVSTAFIVSAPAHAAADGRTRTDWYLGPLRDLSRRADVTDGASAVATATTSSRGTTVAFGLIGLDRASWGRTYGVHVHTGPCVAGEPDTAGPHYMAGRPPSPATEVWLDVSVLPGGWGMTTSTVSFTVPPGAARSIVVHAEPTDATGDAGGRLACVPLDHL